MKLKSTKAAILIILCIVLVATVTIIGANWDFISLSSDRTGKHLTSYTWDEFAALTPEEKDAFADSFASADEFFQWIDTVYPTEATQNNPTFPWEDGGKSPEEYTYSEFLALSAEEQSAFANTFANANAFTAWQKSALENDDTLELPWENGGKQPAEYTWDDFLALSDIEKDIFYLAFPNTDAYHQWLDLVNP